MKQTSVTLFVALSAAALVFTGCKPDEHEDEKKGPTEVAVQVGKITRATLRAHVEAYGNVEPEPAGGGKSGGGARLAAPAAGVVMAVPVKEGEHVEAGAVVVRLDDRVAVAMVDKARNAVTFAEGLVARQNKLKAIEGTSEKSLQEAAQQLATAKSELAAAQAQLSLVQLSSPLAGTVARINVQPGQAVDLNTIVAEIVDASRLVVTASVPASEAAMLKAGQAAEIIVESNDKPTATASVLFVSPQVDAKTGTAFVRVGVPAEAGLRPGQFVRVRIVTEERAGKLVVPRESVFTDPDGQSTLSIVEGDMAKQKIVKVGLRDGNLVEVEGDGVTEGATVVTVGSYALPKETKVRILDGAGKEAGK